MRRQVEGLVARTRYHLSLARAAASEGDASGAIDQFNEGIRMINPAFASATPLVRQNLDSLGTDRIGQLAEHLVARGRFLLAQDRPKDALADFSTALTARESLRRQLVNAPAVPGQSAAIYGRCTTWPLAVP